MSSNSTSTDASVPATPTQAPSPTTSTSAPASPTTSVANSSPTPVSDTSTSSTSSSTSTTSLTSSTSSTSTTPPTSSTPPPSTSSTTSSRSSTTSSVPPTTASTTSISSTTSSSLPTETSPSVTTIIKTSTAPPASNTESSTTSTSSSASSTASTGLQSESKGTASGKGLNQGGTIAIAVVVPIVAVALIVLAGLYFWRKRKARKNAEELRRKEVEEYGYNPNNDPTLPTVAAAGAAGSDGPFEMREDGSSGYRGWGTTAVASSGRKASTTVSGGQSPGPIVDDSGRPISGEPEALGAMGPAVAGNRSGDINRGPSNASSSYSAANRSDGSEDINSPGGYGGGQYYNGQYDAGNPYGAETAYGSPPGRAEMSAAPVIRDVQARRNTRIENPAHFPQQSAGISQNF